MSDDDYMSEDFVAQAQTVQPGISSSRMHKRQLKLDSDREENEVKMRKVPKKGELEKSRLEDGLNQPVCEKSIGFAQTKVLCCGDVNGNFEQLLKKVTLINKKADEARKNAPKRGGDQFRFDMSEEAQDNVDRGGRKRRRNDGPAERQPTGPCWFFLSDDDAEKHLVVSVGDLCYAAMPKGPLVDDHVMVLTIGHVRNEVTKYKDAFTLVADKNGKALVCFERNFKSHHLQIQMVPVPKNSVKGLKAAFQNAAALAGFELTQIEAETELTELVNEGCPYFFAELPDGSRLFTKQMKGFPLQFGREVLASRQILDCEGKIDWRAAALGKEQETELTKQLQAKFKPFDFTEESDSD